MKTSIRMASLPALWVALLGFVLGIDSVRAETRSPKVSVTQVVGTATYQVAGGPVVPIKEGTTIPAGAVITTGAGGSLQLFLGKHAGVVKLGEESSLKVHTLKTTRTGSDVVAETHIELQKGTISGDIHKQSSGSTFTLTLPDGEMDVKQSRFVVSNRGVDALNEHPGARQGQDSTQSTIQIISGQAEFTHDGTVHSFDGAGQLTPDSNGVSPIPPSTFKELQEKVADIKPAPGSDSNNKPSTFAQVVPQPQLQEVPLSPTLGSSN